MNEISMLPLAQEFDSFENIEPHQVKNVQNHMIYHPWIEENFKRELQHVQTSFYWRSSSIIINKCQIHFLELL